MKRFLPFILLTVAVVGAYAPALRDGFVWDDTALILRDPLIRSPRLIAEGFQHFLFTDATASDFYRPVQRLTYTCEYAAFGLKASAYHLGSIFWHLAAAIMLLLFARELLRSRGFDERRANYVASIAALIWAVHPIHSSAVVYISGRADPLAATFGFAGLYVGLLFLRAERVRRYFLTSACTLLFLLSALSKESGLIFLVLWLVLSASFNKKAILPATAAVAVVLTLYLSLRLPAEHIAPPSSRATPLLVRPILAARAVAEYTGVLLVPANLRMERTVETNPSGFGTASITGASWRELQTLAGVLLVSAFGYWMLRERRRNSVAFLALLSAAISYIPVSGVMPLNASVAEHWLYLPSAFLLIAAAIRATEFVESRERLPLVGSVATALAVLLLGGRTFMRTFDWKDQRTFLERTIENGSNSARMLINLAIVEIEEGHLDGAKQHLNAALAQDANQPLAVINRAAVAVRQNDYPTAHQLLARATRMPAVEARAHEMLAVLEYKETGHSNVLRMRLASRSGAADWDIEKRFVRLLAETGSRQAAIRELRQCLETQWYRAESWQLLAQLAAQSGDRPTAAAALARAEAYDVRLHERAATL